MLAVPADPATGLPDDPQCWAYEVKWDGIRVLAEFTDAALHLTSRRGNPVTTAWPELVVLAPGHPDALLDGEIVVLDRGVPSFPAMAERMHVRDAVRARALAAVRPATLVVFDVLRIGATDVTNRPWTERRDLLDRLAAALPADRRWLPSPVYDDGPALVEATREQGLEGVVAKRRDAAYASGVRSSAWVKLAHRRTTTCLVGGWKPESNGSGRVGALFLGTPDAVGRLEFAGKVGSGVASAAAQAQLMPLLRAHPRASAPFSAPVPRPDAAGASWVEPTVAVEVRYLGRSEGGRLRQPVFLGVRADLSAEDVLRGS